MNILRFPKWKGLSWVWRDLSAGGCDALAVVIGLCPCHFPGLGAGPQGLRSGAGPPVPGREEPVSVLPPPSRGLPPQRGLSRLSGVRLPRLGFCCG